MKVYKQECALQHWLIIAKLETASMSPNKVLFKYIMTYNYSGVFYNQQILIHSIYRIQLKRDTNHSVYNRRSFKKINLHA